MEEEAAIKIKFKILNLGYHPLYNHDAVLLFVVGGAPAEEKHAH